MIHEQQGMPRMNRFGRWAAVLGVVGLSMRGGQMVQAQAKTDFKVAWSIYVGWMPWG